MTALMIVGMLFAVSTIFVFLYWPLLDWKRRADEDFLMLSPAAWRKVFILGIVTGTLPFFTLGYFLTELLPRLRHRPPARV